MGLRSRCIELLDSPKDCYNNKKSGDVFLNIDVNWNIHVQKKKTIEISLAKQQQTERLCHEYEKKRGL